MIVRHAERVDSYYGLNWVENAFTYNGNGKLILFFKSVLELIII